MAALSSRVRPTVRRVVVAGVIAAAIAGCGGGKRRAPPRLPAIQKPTGLPAWATQDKGQGYRRQGGQALEPLVIADDPAPPSEAPGNPGQAGPNNRATLNGDPRGLTRETLNRSIQGSMGALAACFTNITQDPMVAVSFEADPSGRPSLVRVNGAPPDAERCIRGVIQGMRFPSFEGKGVQVDLPLSFHRTGGVAQPINQQVQQPTAPPLFMEP